MLESVSSVIQTPRISSKILRRTSYFQLSSWGLDIPMKHCPSCFIYYVKTSSSTLQAVVHTCCMEQSMPLTCIRCLTHLSASFRNVTSSFPSPSSSAFGFFASSCWYFNSFMSAINIFLQKVQKTVFSPGQTIMKKSRDETVFFNILNLLVVVTLAFCPRYPSG